MSQGHHKEKHQKCTLFKNPSEALNSGYTLKVNQAFESVIWYIKEEDIRIFKCGLVNVLSSFFTLQFETRGIDKITHIIQKPWFSFSTESESSLTYEQKRIHLCSCLHLSAVDHYWIMMKRSCYWQIMLSGMSSQAVYETALS